MLPCLRFVRHLIYFKNNIPLALKWMCNCILQKWINDLTPLHSMCTTMHVAIATCRQIDRQLGFQFTLTINTVRKSLQNPLSISEILKMFWKSEQTSPRWLSKKKKNKQPHTVLIDIPAIRQVMSSLRYIFNHTWISEMDEAAFRVLVWLSG